MGFLLLIQYGPVVAGLLLAVGASFARRRSWVSLPSRVRVVTAVGMALALAMTIIFAVWRASPAWRLDLGADTFEIVHLLTYLVPLALTCIALIFLIAPMPTPGPQGSAELAPRTLLTFASRLWLRTAISVVIAVVAVSILAGLASSPDDAGRYLIYTVKVSANLSSGTMIYGWWYSVPCLIAVAIIIVLTVLALVLVSRPALASNRQRDVSIRTTRVRNVLMVMTGGLLLHLGAILSSLYGASTLHTSFDAGQIGTIQLGTSFAAIGPALQIASVTSTILGMSLWWLTLLSVSHAPLRQLDQSVSR